MEHVRPRPTAVPLSPNGTAPKRRKVRKGTQSCWECKRRKIRCTFAAATDTVCDGCKSRQTKCIGQEYQDEPPPAGKKLDRLKRMESIVDGLVKQSKDGSARERNSTASDYSARPATSSEMTVSLHSHAVDYGRYWANKAAAKTSKSDS